ncbi:conserved hypothetical protein [Trichinella spiralis]|uniref:hypothetical protein n=1 Tax=Trichinella spiralis TaxID=6334 RepID=UPI0001EFCE7B|nr:conserved hypothetical protein [Trichinella spiralis]
MNYTFMLLKLSHKKGLIERMATYIMPYLNQLKLKRQRSLTQFKTPQTDLLISTNEGSVKAKPQMKATKEQVQLDSVACGTNIQHFVNKTKGFFLKTSCATLNMDHVKKYPQKNLAQNYPGKRKQFSVKIERKGCTWQSNKRSNTSTNTSTLAAAHFPHSALKFH